MVAGRGEIPNVGASQYERLERGVILSQRTELGHMAMLDGEAGRKTAYSSRYAGRRLPISAWTGFDTRDPNSRFMPAETSFG